MENNLVQNILVLSTSHLIDLDLDPLDGDFGKHRAAEHEYGYVVFTSVEEDLAERRQMLLETPEWLRPILLLAWEKNCAYINFDADAPVVDILAIYDAEVLDDTEEA